MTSRIFIVVVALTLVGCGGSPFTSSLFENSPDGGSSRIDALPLGSGGAQGIETGGAPSSASGGAPETDGGEHGSGGASASGGRVGLHAGGAASSGGAPGTGGAQGSGGTPETGGVPGSGGAVADAGCTLVTHDNGLGQTWQDCAPLGTYDLAQAVKACKASFGDCRTLDPQAACQGVGYVYAGSGVYSWIYSAKQGAGVRAGYVLKYSSGTTTCPNWPSSIGTWN